jgi:hypothetical protein
MASVRKVGNVFQLLLEDYMNRKMAKYQSDLMSSRQKEDDERRAANNARQSLMFATPAQRRALINAKVEIPGVNLQQFNPTSAEVLAPIYQRYATATKMSEIPSRLESLGFAAGEGEDTSIADPDTPFGPAGQTFTKRHVITSPDDAQTQGILPSAAMMPAQRPPIEQLLQARQSSVDRVNRADELEVDRAGARANLVARETELGQEAGQAQTFRPQLNRALQEIREKAGPQAAAERQMSGARQRGAFDFLTNPTARGDRLRWEQDLGDIQVKVAGAGQTEKAAIDAQTQAARSTPYLTELQKLWVEAQPEIAKSPWVDYLGRMGGQIQQDALPGFALPDKSRAYFQAVERALPIFTRAVGEVGNLAEQEQIRQRYGPPTGVDALSDPTVGMRKLAQMQTFLDVQPALIRMLANPAVQRLPAGERLNLIDQLITIRINEIQAR